MRDQVMVDFDAVGVPASLHWRGRTYFVTPGSAVSFAELMAGLTHALPVEGWRVEATPEGDSAAWRYELDVARRGAEWALLGAHSARAVA